MNNNATGFVAQGQYFCLGETPHLAERGDDVCRICGALIQDSLLGSYQLKRLLGSGRSSQAYLAVQQRLPQPVVLKVFPPDPASQHLWERAWQEANQLASLRHRSILPVQGSTLWNPRTHTQLGFFDKTADISYLSVVCQYAPITFATLLAPGSSGQLRNIRLSARHILHLILQGAAALTLVHDLGIAHGALVPGNFLLSTQLDQLWIADFGLARLHPPSSPFLAPELVSKSEMSRQQRDMAHYWNSVTALGDQFAFAMICYQFFARMTSPEVVERLKPAIQRATQVDPSHRFPRVADFVNAMATALASGKLLLNEADPPSANARITGPVSQPLEARQQTSSMPAISTTTPVNPNGADQWEQVAGKAFTSRNYEAAEKAYLQATRIDPRRASSWMGLGDTYFALQRYPDALGAYGKSLEIDPNNADAWFNRGTVLDVLGRADQAALDYDRAEQIRASDRRRTL